MALTEGEYNTYERNIVTKLGKNYSNLVFSNEPKDRYAEFTKNYVGPWPATNEKLAQLKCLQIAAKASEKLQNTYIRLKASMVCDMQQQETETSAQPLSAISVIKDLDLANLPQSMLSKLLDAISHSVFLETGVRPVVVNNTDTSVNISTDYLLDKSLADDVEATIKLQCYTLLKQSLKQRPNTKQNIRTAPVFSTPRSDSEDTERIRFSDVLEELDGFEDLDFDQIQDVKMKAGQLMCQTDKKKRRKRKRDDMGGRIYTEDDRTEMQTALNTAIKKLKR